MARKAILAVLPICLFLCLPGCGYQKYQAEIYGLFGTDTVVIGYEKSQDSFDRYAEIIRKRMDELHKLYDIYNEYGGVNNLRTVNQNAGIAPVSVDGCIIDLLLLAREAYDLTGGAVNVAMGSVLRIWHDYREAGESLPPMDVLRAAALHTDIEDLIIDAENGTVFLRDPGMSLDVGAVAKAYAAALAVQAARDAGMTSVLLNAGGNIIASGKPLDGARERWGIGIQDPEPGPDGVRDIMDTVFFSDLTVSCSGGYQRNYTVDGKEYHHIIDPGTLMPANRYKQVSVIHKDAGLADLLSTALFIMPYDDGAALAEETGAEALWVGLDGEWRYTDGYKAISSKLSGYSSR